MDVPPDAVSGDSTWIIGEELYRGGFGAIHEAFRQGQGKLDHVAKFVPKEPGAARELLFQDLSGIPHIVPIVDVAETTDAYVLVMPRAERSLQDVLKSGAKLALEPLLQVAQDVTEALVALDGRVVHRDLKPGNILLLHGSWSLSDFGISRYAEAATSAETRKFSLSPRYAAPEQWRHERATSATDVYALGVTLYEASTGRPPFPGPTVADLRDQHLHATPSEPLVAPEGLRSLILECLYKAPDARPTAEEILARIGRLRQRPTATSPLVRANRAVVRRNAITDQRASLEKSGLLRRRDLWAAANSSLTRLSGELEKTVLHDAAAARASRGDEGLRLALTPVNLTLARIDYHEPIGELESYAADSPDVVASTSIRLEVQRTDGTHAMSSHSLWYCDWPQTPRYAWIELAFLDPMELREDRPFALAPSPYAVEALQRNSLGLRVAEMTYGDAMHEQAFADRWASRLAAAVESVV